ncbi:glucosylglycerol hydrolase [Crocosphaera sp. UHCC 0190]|uniref:glucosylglycerol hydrolase n=1 Tax=Crocosphaera sp. UHCC 0190 TaxID=3110246 RepID=UPI002B21DC72|nr:glucosylglycerol hydrolase [Crocosphaera sp. UHCC 0190]MEA5508935.1 glucosylglycerol hydrolase [Crocosphaera sp. UHCC 0190]
MTPEKKTPVLEETLTQSMLDWVVEIEHSERTVFEKSQALASRLGAHYRHDGITEIGFWTPELTGEIMQAREIYLEVFTPLKNINWQQQEQTIKVRRDCLQLKQQGEFFWGAIAGMKPGNKEEVGSFYWLRYYDHFGKLKTVRDLVPYSLPFGIFAPAELYDMATVQKKRVDLDYFKKTGVPSSSEEIPPRVAAPTNILQLHVGTASPEGTIAGLTKIYQEISHKLVNNNLLTPVEENYIGYDAIQLLPIEPTIEYRDDLSPESGIFVLPVEDKSPRSRLLPPMNRSPLKLIKPNTQDWGYDVPILGSSATNPALLGSLRPDELIEFIGTLHNFPTGPIHLIYDLVYGHADNQAELLINRQFLKGPNMYGQDLNHQLPMPRAILLEMQRRKINTGADGIRIDGGQDFRFFNPLTGRVEQDDAYLLAMANVEQEIEGHKRLLFTIFEDGRPWPEEGWEEKSTYRDLIELMPESYQWGPLIFAHNTPTLKGFWEKKWQRICEVMEKGDHWITGCGNHDTVRRGNQVDPTQPINEKLGNTLSEVIHNAYDNPAISLWVYGFMPGLPMDFINALMRVPWMFFRNTDDRYGVKVVSEEMGFLDWQITPEIYEQNWAFKRVKSLGFDTLEVLREFGQAIALSMVEREYDLEAVIKFCQACFGEFNDAQVCEISVLGKLNRHESLPFLKNLTIPKLKKFALLFMEDCHEVCNVSHYEDLLNPAQVRYNLELRRFRKTHPWLHHNLQQMDRFNRINEEERTVFYGMRTNPENHSEQIVMVSHLEGDPLTITIGDWLQLDLNEWEIAIASPGLDPNTTLADLRCFELCDSQGLLLKRVTQPSTDTPQTPPTKSSSRVRRSAKDKRKKTAASPKNPS